MPSRVDPGPPSPSRPAWRWRRIGRLSWLAVAATLFLATRPAAAVYVRHDRPVGDYNALGQQPAFAPAGYLADTRYGFAFASATLVSPTKVLTAAHTLDADGDLRIDDPAEIQRLSFGTHKNLPARLSANVRSVALNPAYKGGTSAFDLAVITLRSPVTSIAPGRLSSANAVTRKAALVGYGRQGTGLRDGIAGADDRLGAHNVVSRLTDGTYLTDFDSPAGDRSSFGGTLPQRYEGTTAEGDSGAALWAEMEANVWRVVGVLNGGYNPKGRDSWYGDVSIYASLTNPRNISFLKSQGLTISATTFGRADGTGTAGAGTRSIGVPEPTTLAWIVPLAGLLSQRRSRLRR